MKFNFCTVCLTCFKKSLKFKLKFFLALEDCFILRLTEEE